MNVFLNDTLNRYKSPLVGNDSHLQSDTKHRERNDLGTDIQMKRYFDFAVQMTKLHYNFVYV